MAWKQRIGLMTLVALYCLVVAGVVRFVRYADINGHSAIWFPIMQGTYVAQIVLLAMWGALVSSPTIVRITWAGGVGIAIWLTAVFSMRSFYGRDWFAREALLTDLGLAQGNRVS